MKLVFSFFLRYYIAIIEANEFWKKRFNQKQVKHNKICDAYFKLEEALLRFDVNVKSNLFVVFNNNSLCD